MPNTVIRRRLIRRPDVSSRDLSPRIVVRARLVSHRQAIDNAAEYRSGGHTWERAIPRYADAERIGERRLRNAERGESILAQNFAGAYGLRPCSTAVWQSDLLDTLYGPNRSMLTRRHCSQPHGARAHATFGTSRLTLIDVARARICARSKFACMRSHVSAVLPTACSSR